MLPDRWKSSRGKSGMKARLHISEFALHARAAWDYVVFALARRDTGSEQKGTQFPISEGPQKFADDRTHYLKHLTAEHVTMIENFQPYKGFRLRPLSTLHRLSNQNKHREFAHIFFTGLNRQDPMLQTSPTSAGITKTQVNVSHTFEVLLFEALARALFAVPKKAPEEKTVDKRKRRKQNKSSLRTA